MSKALTIRLTRAGFLTCSGFKAPVIEEIRKRTRETISTMLSGQESKNFYELRISYGNAEAPTVEQLIIVTQVLEEYRVT